MSSDYKEKEAPKSLRAPCVPDQKSTRLKERCTPRSLTRRRDVWELYCCSSRQKQTVKLPCTVVYHTPVRKSTEDYAGIMRVISVSEFSRFCKTSSTECYVYSTDNQKDCYSPSMKITMRFPEVIINLKPNRICFKSGADMLCFEGVKEVQMFDDKPSIGIVFNIVCADMGKEVLYTLIAD